MTPHIKAKKGEFAKTVLMPGDPLRAKMIAETYLTKAKLVNDVRGMLGYTGLYKGKKISVMGHGMGIPSIGIYSHELFAQYGVENIIRIGSAGSYVPELKVGDVILGHETFSESTYPEMLGVKTKNNMLSATPKLVEHFEKIAQQTKTPVTKVRIHASDCFYNKFSVAENIKKTGCKAVEMEAIGLYANALKLKKNALVLLTISDSLVTHESMSPEMRQNSFKTMINFALDAAIKL